jgi:peptide/nickel transport system substrate-binding protein
MNYALDREAIAMADSNNLNTPAYHPNIPGYACYIEEYDTQHPYPYDPEKAIELLKEAGVYENLTIECYTDVSAAATMDAQLVKNMFEKVGITMNINSLEAGTVVPLVIAGEENDCFLGFAVSDWTGSVLQRQRMSCDPNYSPGFDQNAHSDAYSGVYEIFTRAEKTLDREECIELMKECARLEMDEALSIPLTYANNFINCKEGLHVEWKFGDVHLAKWRFE